jgi:hypothetical protein
MYRLRPFKKSLRKRRRILHCWKKTMRELIEILISGLNKAERKSIFLRERSNNYR